MNNLIDRQIAELERFRSELLAMMEEGDTTVHQTPSQVKRQRKNVHATNKPTASAETSVFEIPPMPPGWMPPPPPYDIAPSTNMPEQLAFPPGWPMPPLIPPPQMLSSWGDDQSHQSECIIPGAKETYKNMYD